jgi:hypothetical protein
MSKLALLSIVYSFVAFIGFSGQANAQMCVDMFTEQQEKNEQVEQIISRMSEAERSETQKEFKKFDEKIRGLEKRIRMYSELTGSETNRSLVEAESYAVKIKDQVRLGLATKVVEKIGPLFKRYEVDIRISEKLKMEILMLQDAKATASEAKKSEIEKLIRGKQAERNVLDKHIGRNYYKYVTLKKVLDQMASSKVEVVAERAHRVLNALESLATNHALTYGLDFKKLSIEDVRRYVQSNIKTQHALLKKAAVDEFFLMLRLMTFSGPIVNGIKAVVYKVPEKIPLGIFGIVPARKIISEAFQVGYTKHLRSTYLEDIEMIIESSSPAEQYELLRSLNVKSERPDELIELFSRVVENTEEWEAIKSVAATKALENERYKLFNDRILAADKSGLTKDAFPLYYQESGANAFGKIIMGTYVGGYMGKQYLDAHPEVTQSFFDGLQQFTTSVQDMATTVLHSAQGLM